MEVKEFKTLKINAQRIQSTLISNNKKLRKLRLSEASFLRTQQEQEKRVLKEKSVEKPSTTRKALSTIKDKIMSGPMSIFDKIKEFFGIVLVGFLINGLPPLIQKIQKFFKENPGIIKTFKDVFKMLGDFANGVMKLITLLSPSQQQKLTDERKQVDDGIRSLDNELSIVDKMISGLFGVFGMPTPQPKPTPPATGNPQRFAQSGGYGRYAPPQRSFNPGQQNLPYQPVSSQGFAPGARPATLPPNSTPQRQVSPKPIQKFAKGGTVKNVKNVDTKKVTSEGFVKARGTAKGRKARQAVNSFKFFENSSINNANNLNEQNQNNSLFDKVSEKISIFRELIKGKKDKESPGGGGGGPSGGDLPGQVSVSSDSPDFWLLSTVSLFENSDPQGAADVAQATYNRVAAPGDPWKTGGSIRTALLDPGQYTPVSGYGGPSEWGKIVDKQSAIAFVKKNGKSVTKLETVASALLDSSRQSSARSFVGPRDSFRATTTENKQYDQLANDTEVTRHGHIFGFEPAGALIGKFRKGELKAAEVNRQTRGTVTPTTPPPRPGGNIIPKEKTVVVEGQFRLRPDAADAYKRMKADAKKEGVTITLVSAWRDYSVQAYLYDLFLRGLGNLAAPPGSSDHERGIAIDLSNGIPWAQKNCTKYGWYNSGMTFSQKEPWHFDYRGGGVSPKPKPRPKLSNMNVINSITNIMNQMGESELDISGYKILLKDGKLEISKPGILGFSTPYEIEDKNLQLLKKLELDLKGKQAGYENLKGSADESSNVIVAYAIQPVLYQNNTTRYIKGKTEYVTQIVGGGSEDMGDDWELV